MIEMVKIRKASSQTGSSWLVAIKKELFRSLDLKPGDEVEVLIRGLEIIVRAKSKD